MITSILVPGSPTSSSVYSRSVYISNQTCGATACWVFNKLCGRITMPIVKQKGSARHFILVQNFRFPWPPIGLHGANPNSLQRFHSHLGKWQGFCWLWTALWACLQDDSLAKNPPIYPIECEGIMPIYAPVAGLLRTFALNPSPLPPPPRKTTNQIPSVMSQARAHPHEHNAQQHARGAAHGFSSGKVVLNPWIKCRGTSNVDPHGQPSLNWPTSMAGM